MAKTVAAQRSRTKAYDVTHRAITDEAVRQISEGGIEALSIVSLARSLGFDRTTIYYHFADRDALLAAVRDWTSEQLLRGFDGATPRGARTEHISRFVLANPNLMQLWTSEFLKPGNIRDRYPQWDALVSGMAANLAECDKTIHPELYCTIMLTAAYIAPQVFHNSVRPDLDLEMIVALFKREQARVLAADTDLPLASFD